MEFKIVATYSVKGSQMSNEETEQIVIKLPEMYKETLRFNVRANREAKQRVKLSEECYLNMTANMPKGMMPKMWHSMNKYQKIEAHLKCDECLYGGKLLSFYIIED